MRQNAVVSDRAAPPGPFLSTSEDLSVSCCTLGTSVATNGCDTDLDGSRHANCCTLWPKSDIQAREERFLRSCGNRKQDDVMNGCPSSRWKNPSLPPSHHLRTPP